jgi:hypothetical protein
VRAIASNRDSISVVAGGIVGGALLGYLHVFVLAYMALLVSVGGYKYVGVWAFFLNGTASALVAGILIGMPVGIFLPRHAVALALVLGVVAAIILMYLGAVSLSERGWWIPLTDALQLPALLTMGAWLGSRLRLPENART